MTRSVISRRLSLALAGLAGLSLALGMPPPARAFFGYFGAFVPQPQLGTPAVTNDPTSPFPVIPPPAPQNPPTKTVVSPQASPNTDPTSAPEPTTLVSGVLGAGLAGILAWRRRRKARQGQRAAAQG